MQQSPKRLTILVTKDELAAIDDFRFENRMRNRSDAVRALVKLALVRSAKIKQNNRKNR
jgi:metal-responsive CopG/Arc/MetJ family transcriptional regulator